MLQATKIASDNRDTLSGMAFHGFFRNDVDVLIGQLLACTLYWTCMLHTHMVCICEYVHALMLSLWYVTGYKDC